MKKIFEMKYLQFVSRFLHCVYSRKMIRKKKEILDKHHAEPVAFGKVSSVRIIFREYALW
jgi:hypothetical protein